MKFLNGLLKLFSALPGLIISAEQLFAAKGTGKTKMEWVNSIADTIISGINSLVEPGQQIDQSEFNAGKDDIIKGIVRTLNAAGIFKK